MPLRDQPYLPLYVQDFLTDEKLVECSPEATGIYIRLMCIMHKSEEYGKILLKQKDRQTSEQVQNFACKLAKQMPWAKDKIHAGISELIEEGVLFIEGDALCQKRMIKDCEISEKRAMAGSKGGKKSQSKNQNFAQAKNKANSENEIEYDNEDENDNKIQKSLFSDFEEFRKEYPGTKRGLKTELTVLQKHKDWKQIIPDLLPALRKEKEWRTMKISNSEFCPTWPNLQTWLNQRRWEQELGAAQKEESEVMAEKLYSYNEMVGVMTKEGVPQSCFKVTDILGRDEKPLWKRIS